MDSSDIRDCLEDEISDLDADDVNDDEFSDLDIDVPECPDSDSDSLLDFSSGSDDFYSPHSSDLETSDRDERQVDLDSSDEVNPGPAIQPRPRQFPWVRVYPPESPKNVTDRFKVRDAGLKDGPPRNSSPISYLFLFLTANFWQLLARETNAYAARVIARKNLTPNSRYKSWKNVSVAELKKWFGVLFNMALTVRKNVQSYWDSRPNQLIPFYSRTMSRNRFLLISTFLHMTSIRNLPRDDPNYDPWVKIRWMLTHVNAKFKQYFIPTQNVCIDESLIGMKNRCAFIQYLPNKKHKQYGIKKFEACDSETNYVLHIELYSGRDYLAVANPENAPLFTERVVMQVMEKSGLLDKGYHVFTDNFYTKIPLVQHLLQRDTFMTGTINKNSKHLSNAVKTAKLGERESIYFRKRELLLVGFRQKVSRKPVIVVSSAYHAEDKVVTSKKGLTGRKPHLIHNYNQSMGGVDVSDKAVYHISCNRTSSKFWKKIFFNFIDICMFNAYTLYLLNTDRPTTRRDFHSNVIDSLVSQTMPEDQPVPGPAGDAVHKLEHLPRNSLRKCVVCQLGTNKGRTRFWCAGCNAGVHRECYHNLQHYWRETRGVKRNLIPPDSDSD